MGFVKGDRDVGAHGADINALLDARVHHLFGFCFGTQRQFDRVKHGRLGDVVAQVLGSELENGGQAVGSGRDICQPFWSMIDSVHSRHVGEQRLSGANVRRGLVTTNVLLASLQRHTKRRPSVCTLGDTDDTAWHETLELVLGGEERGMRPAVSHGHTESLRGTQHKVCTNLTGWLEDGQRQKIRRHDDSSAAFMCLFHVSLVVDNGSVRGWVLHHDTTNVLFGVIKALHWLDYDLNAKSFGAGLEQRNGLGMHEIGDEESGFLGLGDVEAHGHGFGRGGSLIEQRGVGDRHGGQFTHHSLEVEQ
mmetsp:Transcript_21937/g.37853  ORF Transcript_21937/g.37853 Transcript_21937/m.37853 type:complete len:305 (-) Transcript_21937:641-1555(-)